MSSGIASAKVISSMVIRLVRMETGTWNARCEAKTSKSAKINVETRECKGKEAYDGIKSFLMSLLMPILFSYFKAR